MDYTNESMNMGDYDVDSCYEQEENANEYDSNCDSSDDDVDEVNSESDSEDLFSENRFDHEFTQVIRGPEPFQLAAASSQFDTMDEVHAYYAAKTAQMLLEMEEEEAKIIAAMREAAFKEFDDEDDLRIRLANLPTEPKLTRQKREQAAQEAIATREREARNAKTGVLKFQHRRSGGKKKKAIVTEQAVLDLRRSTHRKLVRTLKSKEEAERVSEFAKNNVVRVKKDVFNINFIEEDVEIGANEEEETERKKIANAQLQYLEKIDREDAEKKASEVVSKIQEYDREVARILVEQEKKAELKELLDFITPTKVSFGKITKPVMRKRKNTIMTAEEGWAMAGKKQKTRNVKPLYVQEEIKMTQDIATPKKSALNGCVKMCVSVLNGTTCRHGDNCRFSHNEEGLKITTRPTLKVQDFVTPKIALKGYAINFELDKVVEKPVIFEQEITSQETSRQDALEILGDEKAIRKLKKCTKMCLSVLNGTTCRHGDKCRFAHSEEELTIGECFFGSRCKHVYYNKGEYMSIKGKQCQHKHPAETDSNYYNRTGLPEPMKPLDMGIKALTGGDIQSVRKLYQNDRTSKFHKPIVIGNVPNNPFVVQPTKPVCVTPTKMTCRVTPQAPRKPLIRPSPAPMTQPIPLSLYSDSEIVLRVPIELALQAMEVALKSGEKNIRVEIVKSEIVKSKKPISTLQKLPVSSWTQVCGNR